MSSFGVSLRRRVVLRWRASLPRAMHRRCAAMIRRIPDADGDGYVSYPDINPVTEMVDLMGASRSYGLNASAVQAEKGMLTASLDILK